MPSDVPIACVTADDIKRVPSPSPAFLRWAWDFYASDRLDFVVQAVVRSGRVSTVPDALGYLNEVAASKNNDLAVTVEDMRPSKHGGYLYGSVRRIVTERPSNGLDPWLRHGMISHQAIGDLFTGRLTGQAPRIPDEPLSRQLGLFDRTARTELESAYRATPRTSVRRTMQTITNRWERLRVGLAENWDRWHTSIRAIQLIHGSLERLFGPYLDRMMRTGLDPRGDLAVLTLMTWASAVARYRRLRHPLCFLTEIPVIGSSHRFGGGRVDAIGVSHINGRPLTVRHRRILAAMAARPDSFTSTGHVVRELHRYFGKHLGMYVVDFKFLVGDILRWNGILDRIPQLPNVQDGPMAKHEDQMRRYLTLIPFDHNLHGDGPPAQWQSDRFALRGEIWYFLPTTEPVIHQFSMSADECRDYFQNEILGRWPSYKERADIRTTSNRVLGHVLKLFGTDTPPTSSDPSAQPDRRTNRTIYPDAGSKPTAFQIIEELRRANRRFADAFRIIEVIGRREGTPVYLMDFARLLETIGQGAVRVGRFNADRGGKIGCPLPDQSDSTPSMHIYLDGTPHFHCYGCGASGRIDPNTVPDGIAAAALAAHPVRPRARLGGLPVIPNEHHRIMALAQELLAKSYDLAGEPKRYLTKERNLYPALAGALGAGYGNDETVINGLMDAGADLDQLITYGFVGMSANITPPHGIVHILEHRGMTLKAMQRQIGRNGTAVMGLPYAVLSRRLTFPLTIEERHTNFYGRAIVPTTKQFTHRKLSTQQTGVTQGAFNMDMLTSDFPEVIITEGVMDALSLICMGYPSTVALIGVGNTAAIQAIARTGKRIAIALDNDKAGREATPKLQQVLRRAGLTADIRDFTAEFTAAHPGTYKDFNEWWRTHRRAE